MGFKYLSKGIDIKCPCCGNIYKIKKPTENQVTQHFCYKCKNELVSYIPKFSSGKLVDTISRRYYSEYL